MIYVEGNDTIQSFYIGKYPVTQALWIAVMGHDPFRFKNLDLPIEQVSWYETQDFIQNLNAQTGQIYRLPTEAEWEYAAKGGSKTRRYKYAGSNNLDEVGWYEDNSDGETKAVGQKNPNQLGLYDMSGNVWEWMEDRWCDNVTARVLKGGSFFHDSWYCRITCRSNVSPEYRFRNVGFRLAL